MGLSLLVTMFALVTVAAAGVIDADKFKEQILTNHNRVRKEAKPTMANMTWSNDLAATAQILANGCKFKHSDNNLYGENIYASWGRPVDKIGTAACENWESEKEHYQHKTCSAGAVCGHYKQMVWESSIHVGCAHQHCDSDGMDLVVCNYNPAGNTIGMSPY